MKIGFIGLGIMGKPMAKNLIKAGHELVVNDFNQDAVKELVDAGAVSAATAAEVAGQVELILTMLPNSPHVKTVALGEGGIAEGAKEGLAYIDMSSIAPAASREVHDALKEKGVKMLDAPVSGGEPGAIEGTLAFMVGGCKSVFEKYKSVLEIMGASVTYVGAIGAGNITKLANQTIVALNIAAVSEALVLAQKSGVDPEAVWEAIRGGLAGSKVLEAKGPMMLDRNRKPGFRINLHIKDLTNVLDTAHDVGVPVPLTASVMEMMQALKVAGHEMSDHSALAAYYENAAGIELKRGGDCCQGK